MSLTSENNKRIAKNSVFMSIRMLIVLCITLYSSRVVLAALGVEDYGIYNVVAGFVTMFGFLNSSLSNGIQRFFNFELGRNGMEGANKVYNMALFIQAILAIVIILPTEIFGTWYLHHKMVLPAERMIAAEWIFQSALVTFFIQILQVPYSAAIMAHERMDFYAFVSVLNAVLTLGIAFLITYLPGDSLNLYGLLLTIISLISFVLYFVYCRRNFKEISLKFDFQKILFKDMLSFSGWNIFGTLGYMVKDQGVNLMLNFFFGPVVNAARGIANQINGGLQSFVSNITIPVRPQVVQSYSQGNVVRSLNLTYTISKFSCFMLLIISLPVMLEIDYVLCVWLGENVPDHTATFVVIIVINSFLLNLNNAVSGIVHATGKMKNYQLAGGGISILGVIVSYIVLRIVLSPEASLIALLVMDGIRQLLALIILKNIVQQFSFKEYLKEVLLPVILVSGICVIIPVLLHHFMRGGGVRFITVTLVSVTSVAVCAYLYGLTMNEKMLVRQMVDNMIGKVMKTFKSRIK